jgi:hypothetical protein
MKSRTADLCRSAVRQQYLSATAALSSPPFGRIVPLECSATEEWPIEKANRVELAG